MERIRVDAHIHSRFSRATSKGLNVRNLAAWARLKGLDVIGTGDVTHPEWLEELRELLVFEEKTGFYTLKDSSGLSTELPWLEGYPLKGATRFILQGEISSIYKKGGKVRKIHNLVYLPTIEAAEQLNRKLAAIGNLGSDGRPILGLDSRLLLEMVLETDPAAYLIPAHIWTPWFSLFGSKSGFDSVEECYGDLAHEIFALETGLSSDPEMNWLISALDRYRLVSNSDAHSGEKLAREATLFSGELSYLGLLRALKGEGVSMKYSGTLEFFPEEGKYHLDGHRNCNVVLEPTETKARGGSCPVCGKPLTVGVLHRVMDLADRETPLKPRHTPGFVSLIPLKELISEVVGTGPGTKKVRALYTRVVTRFGSELGVLQDAEPEAIAKVSSGLAEGIRRMRAGEVIRDPGFDGQFGVITVFSEAERRDLKAGRFHAAGGSVAGKGASDALSLLDSSVPQQSAAAYSEPGQDFGNVSWEDVTDAFASAKALQGKAEAAHSPEATDAGLNADQRAAVQAGPGPVLVLAGPGTGKTHTLMARVAALMDNGVSPRKILAVTFTRRAAGELRGRLAAIFGENALLPRADTLHALAYEHCRVALDEPVLLTEAESRKIFLDANAVDDDGAEVPARELRRAFDLLQLAREERLTTPELAERGETLPPMAARYAAAKRRAGFVDYTDLLERWLADLAHGQADRVQGHLLVDEVQDISPLQLDLLTALAPPEGHGFFAIGDTRQAIYGFRGGLADVGRRFAGLWPDLTAVTLGPTYRSVPALVRVSQALFPADPALTPVRKDAGVVRFFEAPSGASEASWVAGQVRRLIGATSHSLADAGPGKVDGLDEEVGKAEAALHGTCSPGEIAVLVRFKGLIAPLKQALARFGVPVRAPEKEPFYLEPRVALILAAVEERLGLRKDAEEAGAAGFWPGAEGGQEADGQGEPLAVPERVLARGPLAVAAYCHEMEPFDKLFWESETFKALVKGFDAEGGWQGLVNLVHLLSEAEEARAHGEKVQIMTIHASKGLEFKAVFLPGLEEGILPFAGPELLSGKVQPRGDEALEATLAEERRLFYVGLTRAESALYLSRAKRRTLYGRELLLGPSRFLKELPESALAKSALVAHTTTKEQKISLL